MNEFSIVKVGSNAFVDVTDANVAAALRLLGNEPVSYADGVWRFRDGVQAYAKAFVALRADAAKSASHILTQV